MLAGLGLAGCGDGPEGATLRVTVVGEPKGLAARLAAEATQPTLVTRDGNGEVVAGLATGWRFLDDGRGLIMRLAPVKWADGKPLVARDVVAALNAAARRREPVLMASGLVDRRGRLGARAPIDRVIEFGLARPSPLLLEWLAEPALAVTLPGRDGLAAYRREGTRLVRRLAEARPAARPAAVDIATTGDPVAAIAAFRRGDSDVVIGDGLAGLSDARTTAPAQALRLDALWGVYGFIINPRSQALADRDLRRALFDLADRAAAARQFGVAALAPVGTLLPPGLAPAVAPPADPLVPAARLATAGIAPETPLSLTLVLPPGRDHGRVAAVAVAPWQALGVRVRVITADAAARRRLSAGADWDLMADEGASTVADPAVLLDRWRCRSGLRCTPGADTLLDAAVASGDPGRRAGLAAAAEALWLADPPFIPLFGAVRWALVAPGVDGWQTNRAGAHPVARLSRGGR